MVTITTSAYGSRPVLVSRASRSALGRARLGQLRPPLIITALCINLVNKDIVDVCSGGELWLHVSSLQCI